MSRLFKTLANTVLIFSLLLATLAAPINYQTGDVQTAEAAYSVTVVGGTGTFQQTITAAKSSISAAANTTIAALQTNLATKELLLDGILHGLAKMMLKSMTQSIVNWINRGFQGSPAFMDDLQSYLVDRADEIAGDFIYNDPALNFLCSPFQLEIRTALNLNFQDQTRGGGASSVQCTLSGVSDNIEGFLGGNFQDGGWPAWFEMTQNPQNTPTGAYLAAEAELAARIIDDQGQTIQELSWGDGFLSLKFCEDGGEGFGSSTDKCDITTPGNVIADQLNRALGTGQDSLVAADEINEIISALFAQLAQQAITGVNGLIGLGGSARYSGGGYGTDGTQSYLDAMGAEDIVANAELNSDVTFAGSPLAAAIANQQSHISLQQRVVDDVNAAQQKLDDLIAMSQEPGYNCTVSLSLTSQLTQDRNVALDRLIALQTTLAQLQNIQSNFNAANDATGRTNAISPFMDMIARNEVSNEVDVEVLRMEIQNEINPRLSTFNQQIQQERQKCVNSYIDPNAGGSN